MGSIYVNVILGVQVTQDDFTDVRIRTEILCQHQIAQGHRYCPFCGLEDVKRTREISDFIWKPTILPFVEDSEDSALSLKQWVSTDPVINGLRLWWVRSGVPICVLGERIAHVRDMGPNPHSMDATLLQDMVNDIRARVVALGISGRDINLYTSLQG